MKKRKEFNRMIAACKRGGRIEILLAKWIQTHKGEHWLETT